MSYYEAIVQLRPKDEELIRFVKEYIEDRRQITVAKEIINKFGIDLYINSKEEAWKLGQLLRKKFQGTVKVSKKLFKRDRLKSKLLYRHTVCFRLD